MRDNMGMYRGKRIDNGEWIFGHYAKKGDRSYICVSTLDIRCSIPEYYYLTDYEVIPETVGEHTGENNIYEGDRIKYDNFYIGDHLEDGGIGVVKFIEGGFSLYDDKDEFIAELYDLRHNIGYDMVGTIHDEEEE